MTVAREDFKTITDTVNVDETSFKGATTRELELIEAMISGNKASVLLPLEKRMASDGLIADKVFLPSPSRYAEEWKAKSAALVKTHKRRSNDLDDFVSIVRFLAIPVALIFGVSAIAHKDANLFFYCIFLMISLSAFVYFAVRSSKEDYDGFRVEKIYDTSSYRSAFALTENGVYVVANHAASDDLKVQHLRYSEIQDAVLATGLGDNPVIKIFDDKGIEYAIVRPESEQGEGADVLIALINARIQTKP